jgi:1-acyl-sn-glycerol-3-phosphate acyltransferase
MSVVERARFGARTAAFAGATAALWGCLEAERLAPGGATDDELLDKWVPRWARSLLGIFAVHLRAAGPHVAGGGSYPGRGDSGVGRVFVCNHRSGLDIPITFALAEARLVSRHDLARWPFIGLGARRIGTLFVDRASLRSGATVLKEMVRTLRRGSGVAIYPEGTAFAGDEVRPFRPGAFQAALRTGAEIVPLGLAYRDDAAYFGDEGFLDHMQRVTGRARIDVAVVAGDPIASNGLGMDELRDRTRARVQELVTEARSLLRP